MEKSIKARLFVGLLVISSMGLFFSNAAKAMEPVDRVPNALIEPGDGPEQYFIVVEKESQTLFLYQFKSGAYYLIREYICTTGGNIGDKFKEGDKKTPEGFYIFNKKSLEDELAPIYGVLAFPMDYPNFWDKRLGRGGSGIWLHGLDRERVPRDTNGCVGLNNLDIIDLEGFIRLYDTPIVVYDQIEFKSADQMAEEAKNIRNFIEKWRNAWAGKDFDAYRAMYAKDFESNDGKDYKAWMGHKSRLNDKYENIGVTLTDLKAFRHKDSIVVSFNQHYQGDKNIDSRGRKRLYLRETKPGYLIVAEEFQKRKKVPEMRYLAASVKDRVVEEVRAAEIARESAIAAAAAAAEPAVVAAATEPIMVAAVDTGAKSDLPRTAADNGTPIKDAAEPVKDVIQPDKTSDAARLSVPPADVVKNNAAAEIKVEETLTDWVSNWQTSDLEAYFSHYHPGFKHNGMDLNAFRAFKKRLNRKYDNIRITVDDMNVKIEGSDAIVTFIQDYQSDQYSDYGRKTLLLEQEGGNWLIKKESWKDMSGGAKP